MLSITSVKVRRAGISDMRLMGTAHRLDEGEKSNRDLKKSGSWATFNRWNLLKVSVETCTLGPKCQLHQME